MGRGLSKRRCEQLVESLEHLPEQIRHLREPILLAAKQDQDLLTCGEADPELLDAIVGASSKESAPSRKPEEAADLLREWLDEFAIEEMPWLAPAWFVEGALRGQAMFDTGEEESPKIYKPLHGLQCTEFESPAGMKTKLYDHGIELKNREVQIIVDELDDQAWEIRCPKRDTMPRRPSAEPSHVTWESSWEIAVGPWTACKVVCRHVETGLPIICNYFMTSSDVRIEANIIAKKSTGADLSKYESIIASIRVKR